MLNILLRELHTTKTYINCSYSIVEVLHRYSTYPSYIELDKIYASGEAAGEKSERSNCVRTFLKAPLRIRHNKVCRYLSNRLFGFDQTETGRSYILVLLRNRLLINPQRDIGLFSAFILRIRFRCETLNIEHCSYV